MAETTDVQGSCVCGSVTLRATDLAENYLACHCGMCRRWGGGPLLAISCRGGVELDGEDSVTVYESSEWAERGFCNRCGTHLFYRIKGAPHYSIPVGLFGDDFKPGFKMQVFIDNKPESYSFANETKTMTEAEVRARFAPKD